MSELSVALPPPLLRVEGVNLQYRTRERLAISGKAMFSATVFHGGSWSNS